MAVLANLKKVCLSVCVCVCVCVRVCECKCKVSGQDISLLMERLWV